MKSRSSRSSSTIRVSVRLRPPLFKERTNNLATICDSKGNISVRDKTFTYPAAVVTGSDQVGAFNTLAQHLLRQTEQGYSCTFNCIWPNWKWKNIYNVWTNWMFNGI